MIDKILRLQLLILLLYCTPVKYDNACDYKSKTYKAFMLIRFYSKNTSAFCLDKGTSTGTSTGNLSVSITGLVDSTLTLQDSIANKSYPIIQTGSTNLTQVLFNSNLGTKYNLTITRPASHISCSSNNLSGTLNSDTTVNITCVHICTLNYSDISKIENWTFLQEELQKQIAKGSSGIETISSIFDYGSQADRAYGSVIAPNGKIYTAPFTNTNIQSIDTLNDTVNQTVLALGSNAHGGVLSRNGNIYYLPQSGTLLKVFDPVSVSIVANINLSQTYIAGIYSPNTDRIYTPPLISVGPIAKINPNTNTFTTFSPGLAANYYGCALAPNGMIYCGNLASMTNALKINPITETTSAISLPGNDNVTLGAVLAPNGLIYILPYSGTKVFVIDPSNDSVTTPITGLPAGIKYAGGVLAPNGKIYLSAEDGNDIGILNTNNNSFDSTTLSNINTLTGGAGGRFAGGGKIAANGKIYLPNRSSQRILTIDTKSKGSFCESIRLSPNFNKF